jgi:DNA-binding NtrC family response regulator
MSPSYCFINSNNIIYKKISGIEIEHKRIMKDVKLKIMVLIIEDDKYMNETIREVLENEGYGVESSLSAIDAINKLVHFNKKYNVLILDYNLQHLQDISGIDIFEVAKKINPDIQAIMISAYNSKKIKDRAASTGISFFLEKPFLIKDLVNATEELTKNYSRDNSLKTFTNSFPKI